jgi:hypothetical protein
MRKSLAAICAAILVTLVVVPLAHATEVNVRIEGKEETLFEKTIPVSIKKIQASSDAQERNCDGVNELDPENTAPGITPTLASAEAMESIGETFDGEWYEGFGDYFITRFGPDEQSNALSAWWGILVNNVFTSVGGCQKQLKQDDEVLWIWNAFSSRPILALYPEAAGYTKGPRPSRVVAEAGEPIPLEVVSFGAGGEGTSPEVPSRAGSSAYEGASIAPVTVNAKGFQRINTASPETVVSDAEGKATVTYDTPGTYRIKATVGAVPGMAETAVRSNGLEICVEAEAGECEAGGTPGEGEGGEGETPGGETPGGGGGGAPPAGGGTTTPPTDTAPATNVTPVASSPAPATTPAPAPEPAKLGKPKLDRSALAGGRLKVSWKVLAPGAGTGTWRISTQTVGAKGWVRRAAGTTQTSASLKLPPGHRYRVRLIVTDASGHTTTYPLGTVAVPAAD